MHIGSYRHKLNKQVSTIFYDPPGGWWFRIRTGLVWHRTPIVVAKPPFFWCTVLTHIQVSYRQVCMNWVLEGTFHFVSLCHTWWWGTLVTAVPLQTHLLTRDWFWWSKLDLPLGVLSTLPASDGWPACTKMRFTSTICRSFSVRNSAMGFPHVFVIVYILATIRLLFLWPTLWWFGSIWSKYIAFNGS